MIKRKIVEIIEEYNEKGSLVRKTTTETTEDDDSIANTTPYYPFWSYPGPSIQYCGNTADSVPLHDCTITCSATNDTNT